VAIRELAVEGYRSIRSLRMPLGAVNVIVGPNASGKTNLYRALYLLSAAASGRLARTFADEGGMPSALWAGDRKKGPVQLRVEVKLDDFSYELVCGLPASSMWEGYQKPSRFVLDPQVKSERATVPDGKRRVPVLERESGSAWLRDGDGRRIAYPLTLRAAESGLSQLRDPLGTRWWPPCERSWLPGASVTSSAATRPRRCANPRLGSRPRCWRPMVSI
jgi:predicted ATPase